MSKHYYTDEKNAQIVIALLKAHGIRRIIANPGTTNIAIVGSVQNDPWFEVYSGVDERHSAYMAVGMAAESGEPVVLSCTGATASRNYLPALTEAYYRKLPVLAITSMKNLDEIGQLSPQALDRSQLPKDVVRKSFECRVVKNDHDGLVCQRKVNEAILELTRHGGGPVHINLEISWRMSFGTEELPSVTRIHRITESNLDEAPPLSPNKKIAMFIGSGRIDEALFDFVRDYNVAVFADEGSGYRGLKRVYSSLLCSQIGFKNNPKFEHLRPDLIINVGEISGDYPSDGYLNRIAPVWRLSEDGEIKTRFGLPEYVFEMSNSLFVRQYRMQQIDKDATSNYYEAWRKEDKRLHDLMPELPFSNPWIAKELSSALPKHSILHLGILNSLRSWNCFPAREDIATYCNVGGFGIDGGVSTLIGASLVRKDKLCFGVFGDLAFFYDLNSLGNRHIASNLRILLINNGCGGEFIIYNHPGAQFGRQTNDYIAAGGHFANKSKNLIRHYAQDLGFKYLVASDKEEFRNKLSDFVSSDCDRPIIFECFTETKDESDAHKILNNLETYKQPETKQPETASSVLKSIIPQRMKNVVKAAIGK